MPWALRNSHGMDVSESPISLSAILVSNCIAFILSSTVTSLKLSPKATSSDVK